MGTGLFVKDPEEIVPLVLARAGYEKRRMESVAAGVPWAGGMSFFLSCLHQPISFLAAVDSLLLYIDDFWILIVAVAPIWLGVVGQEEQDMMGNLFKTLDDGIKLVRSGMYFFLNSLPLD